MKDVENIVGRKTIITQDGEFIVDENVPMLVEAAKHEGKLFGFNLMGIVAEMLTNQ